MAVLTAFTVFTVFMTAILRPESTVTHRQAGPCEQDGPFR
jgi:hypothetical protein